jgi:hypothetical protein
MSWSLICSAASARVVVDGTTTTSRTIRSWTVRVIPANYHRDTAYLTNSEASIVDS